jgi:hypothetical protein
MKKVVGGSRGVGSESIRHIYYRCKRVKSFSYYLLELFCSFVTKYLSISKILTFLPPSFYFEVSVYIPSAFIDLQEEMKLHYSLLASFVLRPLPFFSSNYSLKTPFCFYCFSLTLLAKLQVFKHCIKWHICSKPSSTWPFLYCSGFPSTPSQLFSRSLN